MSRMVKVKWVSLPNLLANREIVPEFLQDDADPTKLAASILDRLNSSLAQDQIDTFRELHIQLKQSADDKAAESVLGLID